MFGFRYVKFDPGFYVFRYKKGKLISQGEGLSFNYYSPNTSIVVVPTNSIDVPFMVSETTVDFQEITVQGQVTYRISDPSKTTKMLNYSVNNYNYSYVSDDSQKLGERIVNLALVAIKDAVKNLNLKEAIVSSGTVAQRIRKSLLENEMIKSLGVEILDVSIAAIRPNPETAKALEAETREQILKESDEAIFQRRNYAIERERVIRESELNTELAVEKKNQEIQEKRMESQRLLMQKQLEMQEEQLAFQIHQEEKNKTLVELQSQNKKIEAEAKIYELKAAMKIYEEMNPEILKALANANLDAGRLMAMAFQGIADKADKIGNLNISPDLLQSMMKHHEE